MSKPFQFVAEDIERDDHYGPSDEAIRLALVDTCLPITAAVRTIEEYTLDSEHENLQNAIRSLWVTE